MTDLALIVPAYIANEKLEAVARRSFESYRKSGIDLHLTIVANGCWADKAVVLCGEYADQVIRLDPNRGYAGGVNAGLSQTDLTGVSHVAIGSMDLELDDGWGYHFLELEDFTVASVEEHPADGTEMRIAAQRGDWWGAFFAIPVHAVETIGGMVAVYEGLADRAYGMDLWDYGCDFERVPVKARHLAPNHGQAEEFKRDNQKVRDFKMARRALRNEYKADTWLEYTQNEPRERL